MHFILIFEKVSLSLTKVLLIEDKTIFEVQHKVQKISTLF